jgi:hypothetical protein
VIGKRCQSYRQYDFSTAMQDLPLLSLNRSLDRFIWPKKAKKSNMENLDDLSMLLIFN